MTRALVIALALLTAGCRDQPAEDGVCRCTPSNVATTKRLHEAAPMDGVALLAMVRRHQLDVQAGKNPRAIKIFDDELRLAITEFCQPCGDWVTERLRVEDMFPIDRLDQATRGVCMGLVLRDGSVAYGDARPRACR